MFLQLVKVLIDWFVIFSLSSLKLSGSSPQGRTELNVLIYIPRSHGCWCLCTTVMFMFGTTRANNSSKHLRYSNFFWRFLIFMECLISFCIFPGLWSTRTVSQVRCSQKLGRHRLWRCPGASFQLQHSGTGSLLWSPLGLRKMHRGSSSTTLSADQQR